MDGKEKLLGAPGIATRNKKLLVTKGKLPAVRFGRRSLKDTRVRALASRYEVGTGRPTRGLATPEKTLQQGPPSLLAMASILVASCYLWQCQELLVASCF